VIGTHWVLAHLGKEALEEPVKRVWFELGVGILPGDLHVAGGKVQRVVMTQGSPSFLGVFGDMTDLAKGLGLAPKAISETGLPVQVVSTGLPQMMVPVRSLAEVQRIRADRLNVTTLTRACRAGRDRLRAGLFSPGRTARDNGPYPDVRADPGSARGGGIPRPAAPTGLWEPISSITKPSG
jgi:predicted PhzF superfamily epimerase YddE/YHI9